MHLSSVSTAGAGDEPRTRYLIIAGEHRHAVEVAHARRIPPNDWRYVHDSYQLNGIGHGHTILVYVTWHWLPEHRYEPIRQLVKRAMQHGAVVEHVNERDIR